MKSSLFILFLSSALALNAQRVLYVDSAASGNNDGSNWQNAFNNLDTALFHFDATRYDEIWVAKGTYKPGNGTDRSAYFDAKGAMYGGFAGGETQRSQRDPKQNPTILSGDLQGNDAKTNLHPLANDRSDNSYTVIRMYGGYLLDGFIIEGGNASATSGSNTYRTDGAAIYLYGSGPFTVNNCVFRYNSGAYNGIIVHERRNGSNSWAYIKNCEFYDNGCLNSAFGVRASNTSNGASFFFLNNLFHNNTLFSNRNGAIIDAITYCYSLSVTQGNKAFYIYNNTFVNNHLSGTSAVIRYGKAADNTYARFADLNAEIVGNVFWNNGVNTSLKYAASLSKARDADKIYYLSNVVEGNDTIKTADLKAATRFSGGQVYNVSPSFTDTSMRDFTITSCGSPTNDIVSYNPNHVKNHLTTDFYGHVRPKGITHDAGHAEIQGEITGLTITQVGSSLEVSPGYATYIWYDLTSGNPQLISGATGNTYSPSNDGNYAVLVKDSSGCGGMVQGSFCGSVSVSITVVGDSLVANGAGAYKWYFNNVLISGANSKSYKPTKNGVYKVGSWNPNNPQGCTAYATKKWCGSWANIGIRAVADTLIATPGYSSYQWIKDGSALSGKTDSILIVSEAAAYSCRISDTNACSKVTSSYRWAPSQVLDNEAVSQRIQLFPNPTRSMLFVETKLHVKEIVLRDMSGKILIRETQLLQLDLSSLAAGYYLVTVYDKQNFQKTFRVSKQF